MIIKYTQDELKTVGDRGINRLVAKHLFNDCRTRHVRGGGDSISVDEQSGKIYDFVNCPNDIMPIAFENYIDLDAPINGCPRKVWTAARYYNPEIRRIKSKNENPLRAICEVFILMKQEENA